MTSLNDLAEAEKWEKVKSILEKEPHRINEKGGRWDGTLAFPAIEQENLAILKYLADKGLNFKQLDEDGVSVLHWATINENIEIVKYVVEVQKLDLNHQDNNGNTALHLAASWGCLENVKYLVTAGASLNLKNNDGQTAAEWAKQQGEQEVYEYLVTAAQQRSSKPAATTTTTNSSSASSELTAKIEHLEAQLKEVTQKIEELTKEKKSLQNSYDALQAKYEHSLKEPQLQIAASKARQLKYALATIPAQHLKTIKVLGKGATTEVSLVT